MPTGSKPKSKAARRTLTKRAGPKLDPLELAAKGDRDAQPLTDEDLRRMKRRPRVAVIRRALNLSQEEFAERFAIPIGTLRDWEQGRAEPDQAAKSYLRVIAKSPAAVQKALRVA